MPRSRNKVVYVFVRSGKVRHHIIVGGDLVLSRPHMVQHDVALCPKPLEGQIDDAVFLATKFTLSELAHMSDVDLKIFFWAGSDALSLIYKCFSKRKVILLGEFRLRRRHRMYYDPEYLFGSKRRLFKFRYWYVLKRTVEANVLRRFLSVDGELQM